MFHSSCQQVPTQQCPLQVQDLETRNHPHSEDQQVGRVRTRRARSLTMSLRLRLVAQGVQTSRSEVLEQDMPVRRFE